MATTTAATGQAVIRAFKPGVELRAAENEGGMPTLHGHFSVFDRWAEIDSWMEGHFLERFAPGAFKKTFQENRDRIKVLFQHGQDPVVGDKPLGPLARLEEDSTGAAYEVKLLDTDYNRELIPGLEAGLYGASMRFSPVRQILEDKPEPSDHNPDGIPERTITEARVSEFGPVTFPAYADATAGVRSLTDRFLFDLIERNPQHVRELLETLSDAATRSTSEDTSDAATTRTSDDDEKPTVRKWPTVTDEEWSQLWNHKT
jgi:HK97 family phage prohead protease